MKVVGTGTPLVAQVRFEDCEIPTLLAELNARLDGLLGSSSRPGRGLYLRAVDDPQSDEHAAERLAVEELLKAAAEMDAGAPLELEGPFELMRAIVRSGLRRVAADFQGAIDSVPETSDIQAVLSSATAAHSWAQTVVDLDYVENHGLTEGLGVGRWYVGI